MIIKHIPMKSIRKSNFAGLVQYMTSAQGKEERLGEIRITNCHNQDINWATHEIQATQAQNQRALGDKTYHLVISFPAGEVPSQDVLRDIEERVCASIGYKEHQRISVIHYDTDNFHIHVGINKIHPVRYTLHEPYLAYKKLANVAVKLELEHGLQNTNHIPRKVGSENRADDMEHHAGIESLLGWIKRECMEHIKAAQSWSELHQVMQKYGLELREQGNGLIIIDGSGVRVKASSVARELSKPKLEKRYGTFERNAINRTKTGSFQQNKPPIGKIGKKPPLRSQNRLYQIEALEHLSMDKGFHYQPQPINRSINTVELYARYQVEQKNALSYRHKELVHLRNKKNKLIESALRTGRLKRSAIKLLSGSKINKKLLYALVNKTLKEDILKAKQNYLKEYNALYTKYHRYAWADWLKVKAQEGDIEALDALRARIVHKSFKGNLFAGQNREKTVHQSEIAPDNITKQGTIIYRVNSCAIRDDGNRLNISRGSTKKGIETALHMAIKRYGECLTVSGSAEFKDQVVLTATDLKLNLKFDDPTLEQQRKLLIQKSHVKEKHDESRKQSIIKPRRANRGSNEGSGTIEFNNAGARIRDRGIRKPYQSNLSRIGKQPPPASKNSLRNLSQLSVVQLSSGSEMLLPSHVPNYLEYQRAQSNDSLRRNVSRTVDVHFNSIATNQYIAERESKRGKIADIPKHRTFNPGDQGIVQFAGIRQINEEFLALLKREEQIIVLPINQNQLQKMKHLSINDSIKLSSKGALVVKGRRL